MLSIVQTLAQAELDHKGLGISAGLQAHQTATLSFDVGKVAGKVPTSLEAVVIVAKRVIRVDFSGRNLEKTRQLPLGDTERQEWMDWLLGRCVGINWGFSLQCSCRKLMLSPLCQLVVHVNDGINSLCEIMYILKRGKEGKGRWNRAVLNPNEVA